MGLMDDLNLLSEPIPLDSIDQQNYPDQRGPAPPPAGNYSFKILRSGLKKRNGQLVTYEGAHPVTGETIHYPVLSLMAVEIVEPFECGRKLQNLWKDIYTKPFQRDGRFGSGLLDFIRSYDQTRVIGSVEEGLRLVEEFTAQGLTFRGRLDWTAYDGDYAQEEIQKAGGAAVLSKEALNAIYDAAKVRSMFKFPRRPDGGYSHIWKNPLSDNEIEAKLDLTRFYPSLDTVKLGPATN